MSACWEISFPILGLDSHYALLPNPSQAFLNKVGSRTMKEK